MSYSNERKFYVQSQNEAAGLISGPHTKAEVERIVNHLESLEDDYCVVDEEFMNDNKLSADLESTVWKDVYIRLVK